MAHLSLNPSEQGTAYVRQYITVPALLVVTAVGLVKERKKADRAHPIIAKRQRRKLSTSVGETMLPAIDH